MKSTIAIEEEVMQMSLEDIFKIANAGGASGNKSGEVAKKIYDMKNKYKASDLLAGANCFIAESVAYNISETNKKV